MAQNVENQEDRVNGGENGACLGGEKCGFAGFRWRWLVRRATCAAGVACAAVRGLRSAGCCCLPGTACGSSILPALADVEAAARRQRLHVCCVCGIWFVWYL